MVKPARRAASWAASWAARRTARKAPRVRGRGWQPQLCGGAPQLGGGADLECDDEGIGSSGPEDEDEEEEPDQEALPPAPPPFYCIAPHTQFASRQRANVNYRLFAAAADGCLDCVRRMVDAGSVDPFAESDNFHYNALEYAVHSRITRNLNTWALEHYLEELGLEISRVGPGR